MTYPAIPPTMYQRFKNLVEEIIHGKPINNPPIEQVEEEPSWASSSREKIESVGEVIAVNRYNR